MLHRLGVSLGAVISVLAVAALPVSAGSSVQGALTVALAGGPLETALFDPGAFGGAQSSLAFAAVKDVGAGKVRLVANWRSIAPVTRGAGFDPANPSDPQYNWGSVDAEVTAAAAAGLEPIICVNSAPEWAEDLSVAAAPGTRRPDPTQFGLFASAIAKRYGGATGALPRVRYWQAWNEPNLDWFMMPQFVDGQPDSPAHYRLLVNAFADAVHQVHADNAVVAGGLTPFGEATRAMWPQRFMRELLCVSAGPVPVSTCNNPARFDIWAVQPYGNGGPTWSAWDPDGGSLGQLPATRKLLLAAVRMGHVVSTHPVRLWVTEFSWDTNPSDPKGVPLALHTRWVAEALYRMWKNQVSLVTWFTLRDEPFTATSNFQSGLYFWHDGAYALDQPKPALGAFEFPFVAYRAHGIITGWGRTLDSAPGYVVIEHPVAGSWARVARVRANAYGIFTLLLHQSAGHVTGGWLRARVEATGAISPQFSLTPPDDENYVMPTPFGTAPIG